LLLATGPLFACATSVFAALIIAAVLLACTLFAAAATRFPARNQADGPRKKPAGFIIASIISATIVATMLIALITLGAGDIVAAFGAQMILTAFAAALLGSGATPVKSALESGWQIAAVGIVCELIGHGTLLGDYELAFAGATHAWLLRTGLPPLSLLATPAGGLLVAALVMFVTARLRSRKALPDAVPAITEPRSGRRVRVTGPVS
jgi:hypothetical protein